MGPWRPVAGGVLVVLAALAVPGRGVAAPPTCLKAVEATVFAGRPTVLARAPCTDPDTDALNLVVVAGPSHGVLSERAPDGSRTYTAAADYAGPDVLTFKVSDGTTQSPVVTMTIKVVPLPVGLPVVDAPAGCTITGTAGNDTLNGTAKRDVICGLGGDDRIRAGAGGDIVLGGPGRDRVEGGDGADELAGGADDDTLSGGTGNDRLLGEAGDDTLRGGSGNDLHDGGAGTDVAVFVDSPRAVVASLATGVAKGHGADRFVAVEGIQGSPSGDRLAGDGRDNLLRGEAGEDRIKAGGGADSVFGGAGDDTLEGGAGDDVLTGGGGRNIADGGAGRDDCPQASKRRLNCE